VALLEERRVDLAAVVLPGLAARLQLLLDFALGGGELLGLPDAVRDNRRAAGNSDEACGRERERSSERGRDTGSGDGATGELPDVAVGFLRCGARLAEHDGRDAERTVEIGLCLRESSCGYRLRIGVLEGAREDLLLLRLEQPQRLNLCESRALLGRRGLREVDVVRECRVTDRGVGADELGVGGERLPRVGDDPLD
jgi:hypothetical protein